MKEEQILRLFLFYEAVHVSEINKLWIQTSLVSAISPLVFDEIC